MRWTCCSGAQVEAVDQWGGPQTVPHVAADSVVVFDTPFTWTTQVAFDRIHKVTVEVK